MSFASFVLIGHRHSMVLGPVDYFSSSSPVHRGMIHLIEAKRDGMIIEARGLDSRYMISQLKPPNVDVLSLTTIATPHRGLFRKQHLVK